MLKLLQHTYSDKRVFLTGHTGFKGSWLAFLLNHLGASVKGYALAPETKNSLFDLIRVGTFTKSVIADINDNVRLEQEILSFQPDFIFHLAAQSLVIRSYERPTDTFRTNVMGTVNVLEVMRKYDKPCNVIVVTTDKVYENLEAGHAYAEDDKLGGFDPYSSSKAASEIAAASYRQSFFHPDKYLVHLKSVATARSGNVIGGGDWSENRIIPDLVRAVDLNQSLEVRNPLAVRPWQHLLDPLTGYLMLGARMEEDPKKFARAYNFGPAGDINLTVEELVKMAIHTYGKGDYFHSDILSDKHEAQLLHLDVRRAVEELGWRPKLSAGDAVRLTMEWYKQYKADPFSITFRQIVEYFNN